MFRISALNYCDSNDDSNGEVDGVATTKEAKESEAFAIYNKALGLQRSGDVERADHAFKSLVKHPFLQDAARMGETESDNAIHPGLNLLYSIHKNMAAIAILKDDTNAALESYLEAVKIDHSEVTVWFKIGTLSQKIHNYPLSKLAFEEGIRCNPNHWPCLDKLITVTYALNNYWSCLYYISQALAKDCGYEKGIALRNEMFREQPSLQQDSKEMFMFCDPIIHSTKLDGEDAKKYVEEGLAIREKRRELAKEPPPPIITLPLPITEYTWKCVGDCLLALYDKASKSDPPVSMCRHVDLSEYEDSDITEGKTKISPKPSKDKSENTMTEQEVPMDVSEPIAAVTKTENSGNGDSGGSLGQTEIPHSQGECLTSSVMVSDSNQDQVSAASASSCVDKPTSLSAESMHITPGNDIGQSVTKSESFVVGSTPCDVSSVNIDSVLNLSRSSSHVAEAPETPLSETQISPVTPNTPTSSSPSVVFNVIPPNKTTSDIPSTISFGVLPSLADADILEILSQPPTNNSKPLPLLTKALAEADEADSKDARNVLEVKSFSQPASQVRSSSIFNVNSPNPLVQNKSPPKAHSHLLLQTTTSSVSPRVAHSYNLPARRIGVDHPAGPSTPENRQTLQNLSHSCPPLSHPHFSSNPGHSRSFSVPQKGSVLPFVTNPFLNFSHSSPVAKPITSIPHSSSLTLPLSLANPGSNLSQSLPSNLSLSHLNVSPSPALGLPLGLDRSTSQAISQQAAAQALMALAQMPVVPQMHPVSSSSFLSSQSILQSQNLITSQSLLASMMASEAILPSAVHSYHSPISARTSHPHQIDARNRRGPKRKREKIPWDELGMKRRSARVRNTSSRKKEDSINLGELLQKFLPSSLLQMSDEEEEVKKDETDGGTSISESAQATNISVPLGWDLVQSVERLPDVFVPKDRTSSVDPFSDWVFPILNYAPQLDKGHEIPKDCGDSLSFAAHEEEEVAKFMQDMVKNWGIIDLLCRFLLKLCFKDHMKWPAGLGDIFVQIFNRLRKHLKFPTLLGDDEEVTDEEIIEYGQITLLWGELMLDQWITKNSRSSVPGNSPRSSSVCAATLLRDVGAPVEFYLEDLWYLTSLAGQSYILKDKWLPYAIRVYWLKARFAMMQGIMEDAVEYFDQVQNFLSYGLEKDLHAVKLHNCKVDDVITKANCQKQLESLQRCQSLDETQKWYNAEDYEKAVQFLLKTFPQLAQTGKSIEFKAPLPERHSQLLLLQDSLFKLKDLGKCIQWGEVSFNEAFYHYRHATSAQLRTEWAATMNQIFTAMNRVLDKDQNSLNSLPSINMVRYSSNLVKTIEIMMDIAETTTEIPVATVLPWILLSRLIKHEESNLQTLNMEQDGQLDDSAISSSLMLLNVAHEYLGRHSWCTKSHGALLLYFMDILEREMKKVSSLKDELDMAFEQCVYCLYGHPNKKGKAKHLHDHNVPPIPLTWNRAESVFKYYKPKTVPEFDSYKTSTVSAELGNLLRRIFALVPDDISVAKRIDQVQDYIEGNTNTPPNYQTENPVLKELYYLLADYYFKNKEQAKAIKFYMYDLCANPIRLDSWAGMALARMSQLEQKLGSMELRMDIPIHKKSIAALRCFRRSVEIDDSQKNLWIEYGSLAYQLHSHASRQLKMESWFSLNEELLQIVKDTEQEMLQIAQNCYWKASECEADGNEEEWLHHYMMGKVMEKKKKHPRDYLEHYKQAAIYLHEDEALYPKKIIFNVSPPHLALEALELFYRLHVVMLKQLLKENGMVDFPLYNEYLTEAASSPFAKAKEKRQERRDREYYDGDETLTSQSATPSYSHIKAKPVYHMTPQDHNYSKQKSSTESSDSEAAKESDSSQQENLVTSSQETSQTEESDAEKKQFKLPISSSTKTLEITISSTSEDEEVPDSSKVSSVVKKSEEEMQIESMPKLEKIVTQGFDCSHLTQKSDNVEVSEDRKAITSESAMDVDSEVTDTGVSDITVQSMLTETVTTEKDVKDPKLLPDVKTVTDSSGENQISSEVKVSTEVKVKSEIKTEQNLPAEVTDAGDSQKIMKESNNKLKTPKTGNNQEPIVITDTDDDFSSSNVTGGSAEEDDDVNTEKKKETESEAKDQMEEKTKHSCQIEISAELDSQVEKLSKEAKPLGPKQSDRNWRKELIDKCITALELCAIRYPTHYKTLYRLAHIYYCSPFHKNLEFAKDLLLGNVRWQSKKHMPAPGLFSERKSNNFFQGIWKIPTQEIDRSGSFATHNKKSVQLLLEILLELKDCNTLFSIHLQMNRHPDAGKKFLRDAERVYLAKMSFRYALDAVAARIEEWDEDEDEELQLRFLIIVYRIWNHGVHKLVYQVDKANELFPVVYQLTRPDHVDPCQPMIEQAVKFCQNRLSMSRPSLPVSDSPRAGSSHLFSSPPASAKSLNQNLYTTPDILGNTSKQSNKSELFQSPRASQQSDDWFQSPRTASNKSDLFLSPRGSQQTQDLKSDSFVSPRASQQSEDLFQSPRAASNKSDNLFHSPKMGSQSDTSTLPTSPKVLIEEMSPVPSPVDMRSPSLSPNSTPGTFSESSWRMPVLDDNPIEISSDNSQGNSMDEILILKSPDMLTMDIQSHIPHEAFH